MCHQMHKWFFDQLLERPPSEIARDAMCDYDAGRSCFLVEFWGEDLEVFAEKAMIVNAATGAPVTDVELGLVVLFYLLGASRGRVSGEWISEKDLPGGVSFFVGAHSVPAAMFTRRFGEDVEAFKKACEKLGGEPLEMADAAYRFRVLPKVPLAVLFYGKDDEFDASGKLLFDKGISDMLSIDIIFGLTLVVCSRLARIEVD